MRDFYIDDLCVHNLDVTISYWLKTPIQGLDAPQHRLSVYNKAGEDGAVVSSSFYGGRVVTLEGYIKGDTAEAYEDNRLAFSRALSLSRSAIGVPTLKRFRFTTLAGRQYYFYGVPRKPVFDNSRINYCDFMVTIECPDPQLLSATSTTSGNITLAASTGLTFPVTFPMVFGGAVGGFYETYNHGTILSWPVLELRGILTNPYILNSTTNQLMQLDHTILSGDVVTIDMKAKTIMLNGTSNILHTKNSESQWWAIEPGLNIIAFSSGSGGDTGNLTVRYNAGFAGV